jgi:hypothetical protein
MAGPATLFRDIKGIMRASQANDFQIEAMRQKNDIEFDHDQTFAATVIWPTARITPR